jgi:hypothetical protein
MAMGAPECSGENDCPLNPSHGGSEYILDRGDVTPYALTGNAGDCDWHYHDGGMVGVEGCADACMARDGCTKFTYGDTLGCRVSGCNPSHMAMGAPECSGENDCPLADGYGGSEYSLDRGEPTELYTLTGAAGDCDWHYHDGGMVGVEGCA